MKDGKLRAVSPEEIERREIKENEFKSPCQVMKAIRKEIARQNDIYYSSQPCPHWKQCQRTTCAACEKEAKKLEAELEKRERNGVPVKRELSKEFLEKLGKLSTKKPRIRKTIPRTAGKLPCEPTPSWPNYRFDDLPENVDFYRNNFDHK